MPRIFPLLLAPALCAALSACGPRPATTPAAEASRPGVVLVLIDTLRADRVFAERNGQPVMPFLAGLAREHHYYPDAISPCSWTKPAMASLFTGVYPDEHGVIHSARIEDPEHPISDKLAESWETIAEHAVAAGCTPWAFQTNPNLAPALGFAQGFAGDHYRFYAGASAADVTRLALEVLPSLPAPFFLYAHYMDPHAPYRPPADLMEALGPLPAYDQALLDDDVRFMDYYLDQVYTAIGLQPAHTIPDLSPQGKEAVRHRYDLECLAADRAVATLITTIKASHPDTIFVILSDHGEEFWERGGMGHGTTLHREQVQVPLIIVGPPLAEPPSMGPISTIAVYGYLLQQLAGVPATRVTDLPVLAYTQGPWPGLGIEQRAIFQDGYVLIEDIARMRTALYHPNTDPDERSDRTATNADRVAQLQTLLEKRAQSVATAAPETVTLTEGDIEALDAVGYLGTPAKTTP
jgi:arylsulfatase A-like enzyme